MTPCVVGLGSAEAQDILRQLGFDVRCVVSQSRRGVECADSVRVIRQRRTGNNSIEITVSKFKTQAG